MPSVPIPVIAGDVTVAIDAPSHGFLCPWEIDGGKHVATEQKRVVFTFTQKVIMTHDVTLVIDPDRARELGSRDV